MKPVKKEFAKRLREAMIQAGYEPKPAVLEREFNLRCWGRPVTLHGVRRWLLGETFPTADKMLVLAEWLKIDPQQLRHGDETSKRMREKQTRMEQAINHQEREIFEAFLSLPSPQKKIIREVILAFAKSNS